MSMENCEWHSEKERTYVQWHSLAEEHAQKGIDQIQCDACKSYFFPEDYGTPPTLPPKHQTAGGGE